MLEIRAHFETINNPLSAWEYETLFYMIAAYAGELRREKGGVDSFVADEDSIEDVNQKIMDRMFGL